MSNDFPNLDDTKFPNLSNIDVWKYKNNFEYSRWVPNVTIRLVNVLWNSDYTDVVKFENDEKRDEWFDNLNGESYTLSTMFHINPDGNIKLPIPYEVMAGYNYMYVDMPVATTPDNPIEYEKPNRITRYFYFITDVIQLSPNATRCMLQPDIWTTWINRVDIPYLYLWRGHAPVAASNTDKFLADPINNNQYLLTDDIQVDYPRIVSHHDFHPINAGNPYLCIASSIPYDKAGSVGQLSGTPSEWTNPTYSDRNIRWGWQQQVNGYKWGSTSVTGTLDTNVTELYNDMPVMNVYAIPMSNAKSVLSNLDKKAPHFIETIQAAFVLGDDIISIGASITIAGETLYRITPINQEFNIRFTKDMFGYPSYMERFAKLYTSQYATIEISDNDHEAKVIHIENCGGNIGCEIFSNVAYPLLNVTALFTGIDGSGSTNYKWMSGSGAIPNGDISDYLVKFGIPQYALWQSAQYAYAVENAYVNDGQRKYAIAQYMDAVGQNNQNRKSREDITTAIRDNEHASGDTQQANVANTMNTHVTNTANAGANLVTNTAVAGAANRAIQARNNSATNSILAHNNEKLANDAVADNYLNKVTEQAENKATALTASNNATAGVATGVISGAAQIVGGAVSLGMGPEIGGGVSGIAGGIATIANAGVHAAQINANSDVAITENSAVAAAARNATSAKSGYAQVTARNTASNTINAGTDNSITMVNSNNTQANNTRNMNNTNAVNDKNTNNANASRTNSTIHANANRNYNANYTNAGYDDQERVENAKRLLENRADLYKANWYQSRLSRPIVRGEGEGIDNGTGSATYRNMRIQGLSIRVKTEPMGLLKRVADYFARFGYNIDQEWKVTNLCLMKNFTYWRARDIWVNTGEGANDVASKVLTNVFMNGVTVWNNPDIVGRVGVYDN